MSEFHEQWFGTKVWGSDKHHNISLKKLPLSHRDSSWLIALNLFDNFHHEKRSSVSKSLITFRIISSGKSSNFKSDMMQRASRLVFAWEAWPPFYSEVLGLNLVEADISRIKIIDRCLFSFFSWQKIWFVKCKL